MPPAMPGGVGAIGGCVVTLLHPSAPLRERMGNDYGRRTRLENCVIQRKVLGRSSARSKKCWMYIVTHSDYPDQGFRTAAHSFKCTVACPNPDDIFPTEQRLETRAAAPQNQDTKDRESCQNAAWSVQQHEGRSLTRSEVTELCEQGITVDDDNEPLPENTLPDTNPNITPGEWKILSQCIHESSIYNNKAEGNWKHKSWSQVALMDELQLWLLCFPVEYIKDVVIAKLNEELDSPTDLQEFIVVLGCIHFMACYEGISDRRDWWSSKPISENEGAHFRLNKWISWYRFNMITSKMVYTAEDPPDYVNGFHQQRGIQDAFNKHYVLTA
jgi:hypothetical protein